MAEDKKDALQQKRRHNVLSAIILFSIAGLIGLAIMFVPVLKTGSWEDIGIRSFLAFAVLFFSLILYGHIYQF